MVPLTNAGNAGGIYAEIGKYVALVCIHGEDVGRRWGTWEAMDEPERWRKKVKDPDGDYEVDLVESFFTDCVEGRGVTVEECDIIFRLSFIGSGARALKQHVVPCVNPILQRYGNRAAS